MKRYFLLTILIFTFSLVFPTFSFAQGMMGFSGSSPDNATIQNQQQEEQEGKQLLDKLNNTTGTCSQLDDADFEKIGEYFMGQSIGDTSRHIAMNEMMKSMMGEQGEEQVHATWGKRGSGCDPDASLPQNMMMGTGWGNMMGGWNGFGLLGWIPMLLFWVLLILGVVALFRYLGGTGRRSEDGKPALPAGRSLPDILKERYARGEIDKKEFEQMKKDLS